MTRREWSASRIHRWFAVVIGLAFFGWVASGLLMVLGPLTPDGIAPTRATPVSDLSRAVMSPSEAMNRIARALGEDVVSTNIQFGVVGELRVYQITTMSKGVVLVDVDSGGIITITPEFARQLAEGWMAPGISPGPLEVVEAYDWRYIRGPLPVYRVRFDNGTIAHISPTTGRVRLTDFTIQLRGALVGLHDFGVLSTLFGFAIGEWLLWAASLGSLVVIATGYFMAYPTLRFWKNRRSES